MKRLFVALLLVACAPKRVEIDGDEKPLPGDTKPGQLAAARDAGVSAAFEGNMLAQMMQMQAAVTAAVDTCEKFSNHEISLREERALGNLRSLDWVTQTGTLFGDEKPEVTRELSRIGLSLARASARPSLPWTFGVVESKEPRSFSSGGYVFVTTALLKKCGNEAQLAGVLAREISHVVQKADQPSYRMTLKLLCATSTAMGGNFSPNGDVSDPAFAEAHWKNIGRNVSTSFNAQRETEADELSVAMLHAAGYDSTEYEALLVALGETTAEGWQVDLTHRVTSFKSKRLAHRSTIAGKKPPLPASLRF